MEVKFAGAAQMVTGSAHLLTLDNGFRILMDCGLCQGRGKHIWDLNNSWHFDPKTIDCMILSHAHIDHSGRIPQLVKEGFTGSIHSTHATRSLCAIMLLDSAHIQERDVEWYNRKIRKKRKKKHKDFRRPLYTTPDVAPAMDLFVGHSYNKWFHIAENVEVCFKDQGHILGSASVTIKITEGSKTTYFGFTGDIGRPDRPILRDPVQMPEVDYLICESTYGDKEHETPPEQSETFLEIVKEACVEKKGKLIIPAFSIGRTQEIVYMLDKLENQGLLPKIPVYVDSPLAVNATHIYGTHPECYDSNLYEYMLKDDNPFGFNDLTYVREVSLSKQLNHSKQASIIISSSGMMNAGRVRHHLYNNVDDPKNTFLIVGYCTPDTPGGMLKAGKKELKIFGDVKQVRATIKTMDSFSAHADRKEMLEFISNQKRLKKLFLVHGEIDRQEKFKSYLEEAGYKNIYIPELGQEVHL
ncbi:MAG: MBL fold metallo-hydrolase [Bacteroidia bacterium]|nr:MBL fold metallo-hydrolase [Bacteroidia bacterium]